MSTSIFKKYPPGCSFGDLAVLNLGCGYAQFKGERVVNVDAFDNCNPDIVWDLERTPLPFHDESFDLVLANHILEHVTNWWSLFNEIARVLKENGRLEVYVPAPGTDAIWGCRDHVNEINPASFYGIYGTYRSGGNAWADANADCDANRLKYIDKRIFLRDKWWLHRWPFRKLRNFAYDHLRNVADEVGYIFRKVTEKEHLEERKRYEQRQQNYRAVPLRRM